MTVVVKMEELKNFLQNNILILNPYGHFLLSFECSSFSELYPILKKIAKQKMGLNSLPFSLSALEHPTNGKECTDINDFLFRCRQFHQGDNSELHAIQIIKSFKENPPLRVAGYQDY